MKFSLLGLCAIAIMMTFGFMTVAPFVPTVDAHGDSHSYTLTVDALELRVCSSWNRNRIQSCWYGNDDDNARR